MTFTPKDLMRFGLTAALLSTTSLAACGGEGGESAGESGEATVVGEAGEAAASAEVGAESAGASHAGESGEGEGGESGAHSPGALPIQDRLAFMRGHVEAGLALYRAGAPDQAARHLLHPVSETHAAEREGLDELGFKGDLFVEISEALEAGTASDDIEGQLTEAEENLQMLSAEVGGEPAQIIGFLMDTTVDEYGIGVVDGEIVNAGEYQDAFGFVKVATYYARDLDGGAGDAVRAELDRLQALWPEAPLASSTPTPAGEVAAQVARVQLELSGVR
jgi:hypothetical protein